MNAIPKKAKSKKNKHRRGRTALQIGVIVLVLIVGSLSFLQFAANYTYAQPTTVPLYILPCNPYPDCTITTPTSSPSVTPSSGSQFSVSVFEQWDVFNTQGQLTQSLQSDTKQFNLFGLLPPQLATIAVQGTGFIRISESLTLASAMPANTAWDNYETTVQLAGTVNLGSSQFQVNYVRSPLGAYIGSTSWGYWNQQVFSPADPPGTTRLASFYILLNRLSMPADCTYQSSACIDASSLVQQGVNFNIQTNIQETWDVWDFVTNPVYLLAGKCQQVSSVFTIPTCIFNDSHYVQGVSYSSSLSNFASYVTSTNPQGSPTTALSQFRSATTPQSDTIQFTTTTQTNGSPTTLVIFKNPTATNTTGFTPPPPLLPTNYCKLLPSWLSWICSPFSLGQFNIPWWVIVAGILFILILALALGSRRSGGSSGGQTLNISIGLNMI